MNTQDSEASYGSYLTYAVGFMLSVALTLTSFILVHRHIVNHHLSPSDKFMVIALSALAIIQLFVQLTFFLHLDRQSKPRWNLVVLVFAVITVFIIVGGSLWIMYHLNYNMTSQQMNQYMLQQNSGGI